MKDDPSAAQARLVIDTRGDSYELGNCLGSGGQGKVYRVKGGRLAVKLLLNATSTRRERLRRQLQAVARLPLETLPIARPLTMLAPPHLGYVMEHVTGMVPLRRLLRAPFLGLTDWYLETGGLRRRLQLLARVADVFAALHGQGLVYADPSPGNILVSEGVERLEVRLIDADNLHHDGKPFHLMFTPAYGAPELLQRRGTMSTLTDAHAFGVIAFQTLALAHPLIGDAVAFADPEVEEQALIGKWPWIDHPSDVRNRCSFGLPSELVLSPRLKALCERTFGEGLHDPVRRASVLEWAEHLQAAADMTIRCPECRGTFYVTANRCPWCDHPRPAFVLVHFQRWEPERGTLVASTVARIVLDASSPLVLTRRLTHAASGQSAVVPTLELTLEPRGLGVRSLDKTTYLLASQRGIEREIGEPRLIMPLERFELSWRLHAGRLDYPHRCLLYTSDAADE